jgi:hypothetical protein
MFHLYSSSTLPFRPGCHGNATYVSSLLFLYPAFQDRLPWKRNVCFISTLPLPCLSGPVAMETQRIFPLYSSSTLPFRPGCHQNITSFSLYWEIDLGPSLFRGFQSIYRRKCILRLLASNMVTSQVTTSCVTVLRSNHMFKLYMKKILWICPLNDCWVSYKQMLLFMCRK